MSDKLTPVPMPPTPHAPQEPAARFRKYAHDGRTPAGSGSPKTTPIDIEQEVARKQQLENENIAQDIRLKRVTLNRLFWFLAAETVLIFLFAFFQAVHWPDGFELQEWSFRILISATIAQITGMLFAAIRYLFPKK
jgi:hypothetical protein